MNRDLSGIPSNPAGRMENGYVQSFYVRFRDECLNENWFTDMAVYKDEGVVKDRSVPSSVFCTACAKAGVEDQELRTSRLNHLRWSQPLHHPSMRP
jgi:hypothetical protein